MKTILRALKGAIRRHVAVEVQTRIVDFAVWIEITVSVAGILVFRRVYQNTIGPKVPTSTPYSVAWPAGTASPDFVLDSESH